MQVKVRSSVIEADPTRPPFILSKYSENRGILLTAGMQVINALVPLLQHGCDAMQLTCTAPAMVAAVVRLHGNSDGAGEKNPHAGAPNRDLQSANCPFPHRGLIESAARAYRRPRAPIRPTGSLRTAQLAPCSLISASDLATARRPARHSIIARSHARFETRLAGSGVGGRDPASACT